MELTISVENFEGGENVREINSPRTLEACLRAGLDPSELYPKRVKKIQTRKLTQEMVDLKIENAEKKRRGRRSF